MRSNQNERLNLYLPKKLVDFLKTEAEKQKRSLNNLVFFILSNWKEERERMVECLSAPQ
ncbi:MAG: hypothetical protein DRI61_05105 [Chloroflexi bacterium]|nr:MAG: hypothetical protein DRI61_05105 [Chloroflexota bacterium]